MKVRILSGNATGQVKDLPLVEAQAAIDTGFAELVVEPVLAPKTAPAAAPKVETKPVETKPAAAAPTGKPRGA